MSGMSQVTVGRAISHELSALGVPAPTPLEGSVPAIPDEVKIFLVASGLPEPQATDVAKALKDELGITSIVVFAVWFGDNSIKEWVNSHVPWRNNAPLFVSLKWAVLQSCKMSQAKANHREQLSKTGKIPMDPVLYKGLTEKWLELYKFPLAPSQELSSQLLNEMHRGLFNRNGEAKPVEGLYTKDNVLGLNRTARETQKRRRLSADFDLVDKLAPVSDANPHFDPYASPWLFLIALENLLRSFCKAGTYSVRDPDTGTDVVNVERAPIEDHLAMARSFVFEWTTKEHSPPEGAVINHLKRIDIHLRRRWWQNYNENPSWTFTRAIKRAESLADNQWSFDYSSTIYGDGFADANEPTQESSPASQEISAEDGNENYEGAYGDQYDCAEDDGDQHGDQGNCEEDDDDQDDDQGDCAEDSADEEWDDSEWDDTGPVRHW